MTSFRIIFFQASILLILLFISPYFARISVEITEGQISDICSNAQNPSFCQSVLKSTREIGTADYPGLAKIMVELARSNATNTLNLVNSLIPKATSPEMRQAYTSCSKHFHGVLDDFDDAEQDLKANDPSSLNINASAAMAEADECEDELKGLTANASVQKGCQDLHYICSIILVISNRMPR